MSIRVNWLNKVTNWRIRRVIGSRFAGILSRVHVDDVFVVENRILLHEIGLPLAEKNVQLLPLLSARSAARPVSSRFFASTTVRWCRMHYIYIHLYSSDILIVLTQHTHTHTHTRSHTLNVEQKETTKEREKQTFRQSIRH